jgi:DegV family protein with EDD domain
MMPVKIVTDSTSNLTAEIAGELGIVIVPLNVHFETEIYRDNVDLTPEEFYRRLSLNKHLPTTSAPTPAVFAAIYDKLAGENDEILVLTISSKLSATYEAAMAGSRARKSSCRLEIIDSQLAISALGLAAIAAAKAARSGYNMNEILSIVDSCRQRINLRIAFDTLEYLRRGGRIGTAKALLGAALNLNPILTLKDGATHPVTRIRSRAKALEYLCNFVMDFGDIEELAIEDATTPQDVEMIVERIGSKVSRERIYRMKVSPVIGTHVGPHVIGVSVLPRG